MRKAVLFLGPVLATAFMFACEDDGGGSSGAIFNPDTGTFEGGPIPEAGPLPDAPPPETGPLGVTVTVTRGAAPAANVTVVFHDAAGAVLETKKTGADGKAASTGAVPAMASALLGGGFKKHILTWASVQAGDELFAEDITFTSSTAQYKVSTQGDFSDGGASNYTASVGACTGYGAPPITIYTSPDCLRASNSILARAFDGNSNVLAYAFVKGRPPAAENTDGGTPVSMGPWLATGSTTITPANAPANTPLNAVLIEVSEGTAFRNETGGMNRFGVGTFRVAPGFAEAYQAAMQMSPPLVQGATLTVGKRGAPAANTDIDLATALPTIDSGDVDPTNIRRPKVTWTTAGGASLASTDGGSVFLGWFDGRDEQLGWSFIVAPTATSVTAPAMPAEAEPWLPMLPVDGGGQGASFGDPAILFVEADIIPSYAAFRRDAGRVIPKDDGYNRDSRAVLPANGQLRATAYQNIGK